MRPKFTALILSAAATIGGGALGQQQQQQQQQQHRGLQPDEDEPPADAVDSPWPTYSPTSAAGAGATGMPMPTSPPSPTAVVAAASTDGPTGPARGGVCPDDLVRSTSLHDGILTFGYAIVASPSSSSPGGDILCARLERSDDVEGYIGFGISTNGTMDGGVGIIGLPGDGTVMKYAMSGDRSVELMSDERQTLMGTSITQEDGVTIMEFTKYLREDGENAILANGENTFLYALGAINELLYHSSGRGSFVLDFGTTLPTETTSAMETSSSTEAEGKHYLSCFLYADVGFYLFSDIFETNSERSCQRYTFDLRLHRVHQMFSRYHQRKPTT